MYMSIWNWKPDKWSNVNSCKSMSNPSCLVNQSTFYLQNGRQHNKGSLRLKCVVGGSQDHCKRKIRTVDNDDSIKGISSSRGPCSGSMLVFRDYTILGWSLEWVNDLLRAFFFTPIYPIYPYNKCSFKFQSPLIAECSHQPPPDRPARQMRPTRRWEQLKHENLEWKCRNLQISAVEMLNKKKEISLQIYFVWTKLQFPLQHCHCWKEMGQWCLVAIHCPNGVKSSAIKIQDTCHVQKLHPSSIFHPSIYLSIYSLIVFELTLGP